MPTCRALAALAISATTALAGSAALAAQASAEDPENNRRPLVLAVVVDGLDGDSVDEGRAPFISNLLAGEDASATYFRESRAIIPAVTNANHTAMMTGAYAGDSGIPGNGFALYSELENEDTCVGGPENLSALPTYTSGESPSCPQAQMIFESMKRQGNPDELVTSVISGKPKLGRIFAVRHFNPEARDVDYLWSPCSSGADDDDYCGNVQTNPITGYAVDDATVMDEVVRTMRDGVPAGGKMKRPDFTFVNLPQVDSAGHAFGRGAVYDQAVALADDEIQRLVETLQQIGEWERTVLVVLSDHSMDTTPEKIDLRDSLEDAGVGEDQFLDVPGDNGSVNLVYIDDRVSDARFELLKKMREAALATPGVNGAFYREPNPADGAAANTIDSSHPAWQASGPRIGDLLVTAAPGSTFADTGSSASALSGHHGASQTRDNFLAVFGGSSLVRNRTIEGVQAADFNDTEANPQQAENVDVAATVMGLFGLFAPADNDGRFLKQAFDRRVLKEIGIPERPELKIRHASRQSLVLRPRPRGGPYDLQVKRKGKWRKVLRREAANKVRVAGKRGEKVRFRLRSISAANVKSRWQRERVRY